MPLTKVKRFQEIFLMSAVDLLAKRIPPKSANHSAESASRCAGNPFQESMLRLLQTPAPPLLSDTRPWRRRCARAVRPVRRGTRSDRDPPPAIDPQKLADIPKIGSLGEGVELFQALNRNIELLEGLDELRYRAQKLDYLKKANEAKRCDHLKANGVRCGSPALAGKEHCFFHAQFHNAEYTLPLIEDKRTLQLAYMDLAKGVSMKTISIDHGRLLLQILQSAGKNLPDIDWQDGYQE